MPTSLPPGPAYLLNLAPYFALPSVAVYCLFASAHKYLDINTPIWLVFILTLFARPGLFFLRCRYEKWQNERAAAALGAVLPPHVTDSPFSVVSRVLARLQDSFPGEVMLHWVKDYGNAYCIDLFTSTTFLTIEPHHIKAMLSSQFDLFEKGSIFVGQMKSLLGNGVFNSDGEMWKFHRGMTRPFFTRDRVNDFDIYDRNFEKSVEQANARLAEGYSIDFQDLAGRFTLDSATEFLLGHNVGSLSAEIPYPPFASHKNPKSFYDHPSNKFLGAFTEAQIGTAVRTTSGTEWPFLEFWQDKVTPSRKIIDDFSEPLIEKALNERELGSKIGAEVADDEDMTLLAHLVKVTQDKSILKDELVNLFVAGRDSTMSLLTYSMYMLVEHPEIERRLRQEIFDVVGPSTRPTQENIRNMKFMRAFLNEVLRLYPPVPSNVRTAKSAVLLPSEHADEKPMYLPAHTLCIFAVVNLHRRTDLWGPDALKFDPDRFLDERLNKYLTPNPYIFCPFNAGPRICLGQQFAYHEATFYLVRLLQRFTGFRMDEKANTKPPADWAQKGGRNPIEKVFSVSHLTMYMKGGFWLQMEELKPS